MGMMIHRRSPTTKSKKKERTKKGKRKERTKKKKKKKEKRKCENKTNQPNKPSVKDIIDPKGLFLKTNPSMVTLAELR